MSTETLILTKTQLLQKINRIAYEVFEQNFKEEHIVFAGIEDNGYLFAKLLVAELQKISKISVTICKVSLDKLSKVQARIEVDVPANSLKGKTIILTDDVLNTGRVLAYSLQPFLAIELHKIQTAVVVDRSHQLFPIAADYVGYSLATTIREHIEVSFDKDRFGVYLH